MVTRFELKMPAEQRRELDALAAAIGTTTAELLRIGGSWVLNNREFFTKGRVPARDVTGVAA